MHHKAASGIDRTELVYWLTGNGHHQTRLHCTDGDLLLCVCSILFALLLFTLYAIYSVQSQKALRSVEETHFRKHLMELRNVFVLCGMIHVMSSAVAWFVPMYWTIVCMMAGNCLFTLRLIRSKSEVLAIHQHYDGLDAIEKVTDAVELMKKSTREAESEAIHSGIDRLEEILRGIRG